MKLITVYLKDQTMAVARYITDAPIVYLLNNRYFKVSDNSGFTVFSCRRYVYTEKFI